MLAEHSLRRVWSKRLMGFKNLWDALCSREKRGATCSRSASPILQAIYQSLEEHRQIVDRLKRYEDITYRSVTRRLAVLKQEVAAIFQPTPRPEVIINRRFRERRQIVRPVVRDRRIGTDRRAS